jgi:hypothetical protein
MSPDEICSVCGRSILSGERVHRYLADEEAREVCELCVARAERLGWRPEAEEAEAAPQPEPELTPTPEPEPEPEAPRGPDPAAPGMRPSSPAPEPAMPHPFERALARFNGSETARTVAGLTRTLGRPSVSVGASAAGPQEVRVTVAWELSWYQWGVDLADELRPVFEIDKGSEIEQLDAAAQQWNASVGEYGELLLGAPGQPTAGQTARG